ncbi:MAG: arginine N-succinyltransferase [Epsilonproteobacteria bacterium]|nr:MAG: arginine N-succinyltransferase [Campylobacterota bacterium]RLA67531.1 MAG: arginine N-succinyltransferase [Campylobacterota bacterium]
MFIIRSVENSDLDELMELSKLANFINLPSNLEMLKEKIASSQKSFKNPSSDLWKNNYFFVLEDLDKKKIAGVSMIHAQHGTREEPHFYLAVGKEKKYSKTLRQGHIHGTLTLGFDQDGPTEIGGLVLHPQYRGKKLGKQLSLVRFLYLAIHPENFKDTIHAELLPPFDSNGNSPLWEAIGRRFLNMDYQEADDLSRTNKEFILDLFPREKIYETLLPMDARNAIGKVGKTTIPVKKMLEKIGFKYTEEIDPFDGGPHYRAKLDKITTVENMFQGEIVSSENFSPTNASHVILSLPCEEGKFLATQININLKDNKIIPERDLEIGFKTSGVFI